MDKNYWLQHYSGSLCLSIFLFLFLDKSATAFPEVSPRISSGFFHPSNLTIAQNCTKAEVEQYISAFNDRWQQDNAVRQLVACGQTAIPALMRVMQTEKDAGIRQTAAASLGYIGGSDALKTLSDTLRNDSAATVRKIAADALGTIGDTAAIPLLIATLENGKEVEAVRQSAATSLGDIGSKPAIEALIATLKSPKQSLNLRQSAVKALQKIGDPAIEPLVTTLQSIDLRTQYGAVVALSEINSVRSTKALEANKVKVAEILEDAYKSEIVEFDRVPPDRVGVSRKPILCRIKWFTQHWDRCR
jgi:HEAT repeats/PBS lyase HEAT-like repeat